MRTRRKKKPQKIFTNAEYDGYFYLFFPPANKKNIDTTKEWAKENNYPVEACDIMPSGACVFRVKDEDFEWLPREKINQWNEGVRGLCIPNLVHSGDPFYPAFGLARCNPVHVLTKNWVAINCKKKRNRGITNDDAPDIRSKARNRGSAPEEVAGAAQQVPRKPDHGEGDKGRRPKHRTDSPRRRRRRGASQI